MDLLLADVAPTFPEPPAEPVALSVWPVMIAACFIALAWAGVAVLVSKRLPNIARAAIVCTALLMVLVPAGVLWAKWNTMQEDQYAAEIAEHEAECARIKAASRASYRRREQRRYEYEMQREIELQLQHGDKLLAEMQAASDDELLKAYVALRSHYFDTMDSYRHVDCPVDTKRCDSWLSALQSVSSSERLESARNEAAIIPGKQSLLQNWEDREAQLANLP